jgi:sulfatase modifying factor 1
VVPSRRDVYTNLFKNEGTVAVAAFPLDRYPVTNADYLEFVRQRPAWQRSQVKRLFADASYLSHWTGDLEPGPHAPVQQPGGAVSWFAARAYAKWKGQRLPTLAEWELAARADDHQHRGRASWPGTAARCVVPCPRWAPPSPKRNGVWDLHGLVWEWVNDFNTALVTGESRADTGLDA